MAKGATFFSKILFLLLILSSFVFGNEARILKPENSNVLDGFYVAAIKVHGGPSRGGEGHARTNRAKTLEGIKKSGPNPGINPSSYIFGNEARMMKPHSSLEMEIMKVLDDLYIEAVKTGGGPSPRGEGHATTNRALTLEGIKKSGPSPGAGN
ncbi:hypothetical protein SASPL_103044 [Salvia splendens]|uniref:Dirigent protein n=1 Tax=Salvia splendens TaxID=180675 RepID=A0A8X8YYA6_SALSN|nr:hypothetical protein SASPL_103044 [Salvia splendens]